ncbi:MAG: MFS transporter [Thermoleophilia bacterium]
MYDDAAIARIQRRTLRAVVVSQVLGGAGLAAGITVGALLAEDMLGSEGLSGLPVALFTFGSAIAALLVGRVTQRWGRRAGLAGGFLVGAVGAAGVVVAAAADNVPLLFAAMVVYGSGTATNLQARYAGTDLAEPSRRGFAISVAMVATTLGAVVGPNLVDPLGALAEAVGVPELAGPFLLAGAGYLAAGAALFALLRPDPFIVARDRAAAAPLDGGAVPVAGTRGPAAAGVYAGATVMILAQLAMVAIMTMTPPHMRDHGLGLSDVGVVIGIHVAAMYLPSLVTGILVDRVGRAPMAMASGATLLLAGVTGALAPGGSLGLMIVALALLGLGWNLGIISGTAMIVDATRPESRARTQGAADVGVALAGAGGGAVSGLVVAAADFGALCLIGGVLALLVVPVLIAASSRRPPLAHGN